MTTVVGIDLAAGRGTTEVVTLWYPTTRERPRYLRHLRQHTVTDADIAAAAASTSPAAIAIDAPLSLPATVMAARYVEGAFVAVGDASEGQIMLPYPFIEADTTPEK